MRIISGEEAYDKKKGNMATWDAIDDITEEYLKTLAKFSEKKIRPRYDTIMRVAKEITSFAVEKLEEECNAEFVYVDCNY